jgi:hypothetical protein
MPFIHTLADEPNFSEFGACLQFPFPCPFCGQEFQQTLGSFERENNISCPNCKETVRFDAKTIRSALVQLRDAAGDLWRSVGYDA